MGNEKTENHIKELSEAQLDALRQLQIGLPEGMINAATIKSLDERDLINRIQFTSPRSMIAVAGWALSEEGNKIVEQIKAMDRETALREAGIPPEPKKTKAKKTKDDAAD